MRAISFILIIPIDQERILQIIEVCWGWGLSPESSLCQVSHRLLQLRACC
jgi:hypothetical protein